MGVIDYSLFLKEGNYLERPPGSNEDAKYVFSSVGLGDYLIYSQSNV